MTERSDRIVAVVRHRESVLVCRESTDDDEPIPALPMAEIDERDPEGVLIELLDDLGLLAPDIERRGDPIDADAGRLIPYLVSVSARSRVDRVACPDPSWVAPSALADMADGQWWVVYEAVSPTVEAIAVDAERGSSAIAVDALWVLRDAANRAVATDGGFSTVAETAKALLDAHPTMAALANRVNRTMAGAGGPADVVSAATNGIVRAFEADGAAATLAADTIGDGLVLTLSRSGTVREALLQARPAVVVLASLPGGEGRAVGESLDAAGLAVDVMADAAVYERLRAGDVDAVLFGADAVTADGTVSNKAGTWAVAHAAGRAGVPVYVACSSDKIRPADWTAPRSVEWLFDRTPASRITALLTERGRVAPDDVSAIAETHRGWAEWQDRGVVDE